jgi:isoleucyl-tRNA synthetase
MSDTKIDYKASVFLPRTEFPMRGDLPVREPALLARWEEMGLWARLRAAAAGRPSFILHDGPPYANGNLHIGHALNKIHKDVINRAQAMAGRDANYIPGWDCHGLPIEWKIEEAYRKAGKNKDEVPVLEFRRECREYAQKWLDVQAAEFKRLGVAGDWARRYATMDFASEAAIAAEIGKFLMNGALYRGLRPVMWSPVEKTALAEAEVEYQDREDTAIYVRFAPAAGNPVDADILIWTTTPWTIPGNRGLAVGAAFDYAVLEVSSVAEGSLARVGERLLMAAALIEDVCAKTGITAHKVLRTLPGMALDGARYRHPLASQDSGYDFTVPVMLGEFVTTDAGTGIVHMSPGHGEDDFWLCQQHGVTVPETVQGDGTYYPGVPLFAGVHVYKAAEPVCAALLAAGTLLHRAKFMHSYPHSWRSKAPLIYRATPNWFIRMDGEDHIRDKALAAIDETHFVPAIGRNRIRAMVASRPDWCISRQRAWGVPIPVFVNKTTFEPLRDAAVLARIDEIFRTEGADAWYARPAQDFLGADHAAADYEQIFDIVDVWFESGSTHAFVLEARGLPTPADLYLEGSDQHRGWFQASLLESVGTRGGAPFKAIVTDGFVLDENGRKMSKSLGNVTGPQEVNDKYGADILRLWVMNSDTSEDLRIGPEILKQQAELYRRLRNTLRWLLGSLDGFSESEIVPLSDAPPLERFILHRLAELDALFQGALRTHDWTGIYPALHHFCATDLSAFYFDIRKDALYCDTPASPTRRACRTVLDILHRTLTAWLAPALPFTAEDAWSARFGNATSVHETLFAPVPAGWTHAALAAMWARLREVRGEITAAIETMRREKVIGASLQAAAIVPADAIGLLPDLGTWAELCITSAAQAGPIAGATLAQGQKCERCWRVLPEVGANAAHPTLCTRCCDAV